MKIVYQNEDVVFVSIHSLHKVSKYKGKEGEAPRLNKLGTGAWEKLKDRTKTKIKDIARDLINSTRNAARRRGSNTVPTASCNGSWKPPSSMRIPPTKARLLPT